jgi:tetratricopeptide (TPR) repeat protein
MVNLGAAYIGAERYDDAERILQQALEQYPEVAGVHRNLGLLYQKTDRVEKSISHFKTYFRLHPEDTGLAKQYAESLRSQNRTAEAVQFLEQIQSENSPQINLMLAQISAETGDVAKAILLLKRLSTHLSPSEVLSEMKDESFDKIRHLDAFEKLVRDFELSSVFLPTEKVFSDKTAEFKIRD